MKIIFQLFITFFNIGAFTLGGGYAMLDMVEKAVVGKRHWIQKDEFWDLITIVQTLPGVFAVNTALYVGYKIKGVKGAIVACLGAIIPSIVIILLIAIFFTDYKNNPVIEKIFKGIRPCVVALILSPSIKICLSAHINIKTVIFPLLTVFLIWWCKISPVYIILIAVAASIGYAFYAQKRLKNIES